MENLALRRVLRSRTADVTSSSASKAVLRNRTNSLSPPIPRGKAKSTRSSSQETKGQMYTRNEGQKASRGKKRKEHSGQGEKEVLEAFQRQRRQGSGAMLRTEAEASAERAGLFEWSPTDDGPETPSVSFREAKATAEVSGTSTGGVMTYSRRTGLMQFSDETSQSTGSGRKRTPLFDDGSENVFAFRVPAAVQGRESTVTSTPRHPAPASAASASASASASEVLSYDSPPSQSQSSGNKSSAEQSPSSTRSRKAFPSHSTKAKLSKDAASKLAAQRDFFNQLDDFELEEEDDDGDRT